MDALTLQTAFKMLVALGVVLIVFGFCVFLFKQLSRGRGVLNFGAKKKVERQKISVGSHCSLGPGKTLHVVEVDGRRVLIGVTQHAISTLLELEEDLQVESGFKEDVNSSGNVKAKMKSFGDLLKEGGRDIPRV